MQMQNVIFMQFCKLRASFVLFVQALPISTLEKQKIPA